MREAYANDASAETLKELLGRGRAKKGMFEGDLQEGELEIGQVSSRIDEILSVEDIVKEIISDYQGMNAQGRLALTNKDMAREPLFPPFGI